MHGVIVITHRDHVADRVAGIAAVARAPRAATRRPAPLQPVCIRPWHQVTVKAVGVGQNLRNQSGDRLNEPQPKKCDGVRQQHVRKGRLLSGAQFAVQHLQSR